MHQSTVEILEQAKYRFTDDTLDVCELTIDNRTTVADLKNDMCSCENGKVMDCPHKAAARWLRNYEKAERRSKARAA